MTTPSEAHLLAFGRITHSYATVESGIKIALSGILQIDLVDALVILEPHSAPNLKNVARILAKQRLKPKLAATFVQIIGDWAALSTLRNTICHSRWTVGGRVGSITPRNLSIQKGRATLVGDFEEEKSYTAAELEAEAYKLHDVNERLKAFLKSSGLERIIESKLSDGNDKPPDGPNAEA